MKKYIALVLVLSLLFLPGCGKEKPPALSVFDLKFWEMNAEELTQTLTTQGWTLLDFPEHGITFYVGEALGLPSYLRAEYSAETGLATAVHVMTLQYPAAMQEAWEAKLERYPDYMYGRPWSYYNEEADVTMAAWLSDAKAAVLSAGGEIAEEGTYRLSGSTPEEIRQTVAGPLAQRFVELEYGEQFYTLPNGLYCSYYDAAKCGWSSDHAFEPYPMFSCLIFLCTEDYEMTDYHWRWQASAAPQHEQYETTVDQPTQFADMTA